MGSFRENAEAFAKTLSGRRRKLTYAPEKNKKLQGT
jgi:hypothetical protein